MKYKTPGESGRLTRRRRSEDDRDNETIERALLQANEPTRTALNVLTLGDVVLRHHH